MRLRHCGCSPGPIGLALDDPGCMAAARATGADVPVCLDPRPRRDARHRRSAVRADRAAEACRRCWSIRAWRCRPRMCSRAAPRRARVAPSARGRERCRATCDSAHRGAGRRRNDLEAPAIAIPPVIADVLAALARAPDCRLARMSGSGATCFGLFASLRAAAAAAARCARSIPVVGAGDGARLSSYRPAMQNSTASSSACLHRARPGTAPARPGRWRRSGGRARSCPPARGA